MSFYLQLIITKQKLLTKILSEILYEFLFAINYHKIKIIDQNFMAFEIILRLYIIKIPSIQYNISKMNKFV